MAALPATLVTGCGSEAQRGTAPVLWIIRSVDGSDQYVQVVQKCSDTSGGKYRLGYGVLAKQTGDQCLQLTRCIVGGDSSFNIMGLDVTWTPEFAETGQAPPLPGDMAKHTTKGTLSGPLDTATWQDRLYGAPLSANTQLLWYRKSLVDGPPKTWDDLIASERRSADESKPSTVGVQAAQHEGSVAWFNLTTASAGGQLVAPDGQLVTIADNDAAERALDTMHRVATVKGYDPSVLQSDEDQARLAFGYGDASAQVSYPFAYAGVKKKAGSGNQVVRKVFGDMAWTIYPAVNEDTPAQVMTGGLNLAMPSTPKHPELAFEVIDCLRNEQNQFSNALEGGLPPTLTKLYMQATDDFKRKHPFYRGIYEQLNTLEESDPAELTQEERALLPLSRMASVVTRLKSSTYQPLSVLMISHVSPPENVSVKLLIGTPDEELQAAVSLKGLVP